MISFPIGPSPLERICAPTSACDALATNAEWIPTTNDDAQSSSPFHVRRMVPRKLRRMDGYDARSSGLI